MNSHLTWGWFVGDFLRSTGGGLFHGVKECTFVKGMLRWKSPKGPFSKEQNIIVTEFRAPNIHYAPLPMQLMPILLLLCWICKHAIETHARHKAPVVEKLKSDELLLTYFQHQMTLVLAWFGTSNAATLRTWHQWAHPHHWLHPLHALSPTLAAWGGRILQQTPSVSEDGFAHYNIIASYPGHDWSNDM